MKTLHVRLAPDLTAPVVKSANENSRSIPKEVSHIVRQGLKKARKISR